MIIDKFSECNKNTIKQEKYISDLNPILINESDFGIK